MTVDEKQLIRAARQGDQAAMELIFKIYVDKAVYLAFLITKDWTTAEDVVQDAFIRAFRNLKSFKEGRPFKPWFTKIVVNQAKSNIKKTRHFVTLTNIETANISQKSMDELAIERDERRILLQAVHSLKETHRIPILLKYFSGLTEAEVSTVLDLPVSTVKSRLYEARQKLKDILEKSGEDC
ncbi:MAG: RNA polymerase sigma factor [Clostridiales bacterium]|jgi:RNA polymerase sigma-70 factor (ECF subfamily)|nr:RNA polymerase sigma factor [Clostridiales bacterium]